MGNNSSILFDTVDGYVYNEAYDKANSSTVSTSKGSNAADRLKYAQSGHVLNDSQNAAIEQDSRNINIIDSLTNSDRQAIYFGYKENITRPMYGKGSNSSIANDETYFNYLKGYIGSFLYSPYSWYSTDSDVGFGEFLALQAGNALYQLGDAVFGDDDFNDALTDWWEQAKGPYDALNGELVVRDELKGKFLKVHLSDANTYVYVGIGLDGQFKVLADTDISTDYINSEAYEAPSVGGSGSWYAWANVGQYLTVYVGTGPRGGDNTWQSLSLDFGLFTFDPIPWNGSSSVSSSGPDGSCTGTATSVDGTITWDLDLTFNGGSTFIYDNVNYTLNSGSATLANADYSSVLVTNLITVVPDVVTPEVPTPPTPEPDAERYFFFAEYHPYQVIYQGNTTRDLILYATTDPNCLDSSYATTTQLTPYGTPGIEDLVQIGSWTVDLTQDTISKDAGTWISGDAGSTATKDANGDISLSGNFTLSPAASAWYGVTIPRTIGPSGLSGTYTPQHAIETNVDNGNGQDVTYTDRFFIQESTYDETNGWIHNTSNQGVIRGVYLPYSSTEISIMDGSFTPDPPPEVQGGVFITLVDDQLSDQIRAEVRHVDEPSAQPEDMSIFTVDYQVPVVSYDQTGGSNNYHFHLSVDNTSGSTIYTIEVISLSSGDVYQATAPASEFVGGVFTQQMTLINI